MRSRVDPISSLGTAAGGGGGRTLPYAVRANKSKQACRSQR
jgi:hypothetical protein